MISEVYIVDIKLINIHLNFIFFNCGINRAGSSSFPKAVFDSCFVNIGHKLVILTSKRHAAKSYSFSSAIFNIYFQQISNMGAK